MSTQIPESIEYLDWTVKEENKEEEEPELIHYLHPTMAGFRWCGEKAGSSHMSKNGEKVVSETGKYATCPGCQNLEVAFGWGWWWNSHRGRYKSNCGTKNGIIFHECGA